MEVNRLSLAKGAGAIFIVILFFALSGYALVQQIRVQHRLANYPAPTPKDHSKVISFHKTVFNEEPIVDICFVDRDANIYAYTCPPSSTLKRRLVSAQLLKHNGKDLYSIVMHDKLLILDLDSRARVVVTWRVSPAVVSLVEARLLEVFDQIWPSNKAQATTEWDPITRKNTVT